MMLSTLFCPCHFSMLPDARFWIVGIVVITALEIPINTQKVIKVYTSTQVTSNIYSTYSALVIRTDMTQIPAICK